MTKSLRSVLIGLTLLVLLFVLLQSLGCTLMTHTYRYSIQKVSTDAPDGVDVYLSFAARKHNTVKIPVAYDIDSYRDPFGMYFTVWGAFDEILNISLQLQVNDQPPIPIPLNLQVINANRKHSHTGDPLFPAGKVLTLDIDVQTIDFLEVVTTFTATKDGKEKSYTITNHYAIDLKEYKSNRFLSALLSA